jgi:hypothetical protein
MSRTVDGTVGLTKNQPPTVTRPFDFGTDAIERQRVSLGQSIIDADFEYGLQATKWQTYQEIRKMPSFYEIPGTDIQVTSVTTDGATPSIITVNINTSLTTLPSTLLFVGSIISIVGLANSQRNADRSEGFFVVRTVTGSPVTSFTFEARGVVSGTTVSTSYTVLRRGGVYTNGNAFLPYAAITTNGASPSVITIAYPPATPHGLLAGTPIQTTFPSGTIGTIVGGLDTNATGSFTIISTPTANSFTFTATGQVGNAANQTATKAQMASATSNIFVSPYSYAVHRPFDGGVLLSPGQPSFGASSLRQSKKVFRYQSGKGLLWSSGTLFCPNNDVVYANVVGSVINVVCDVPHGSPQAGATIQLKGISTPGYNGTYIVSSIIDSRTLSVRPAVVPTVSPAVLGDQPRFIMNGWAGASVRAGCFEDQNGLFWEWDGQTLWAIKRSSTFQLGGYVTATVGSQVINGDTSDTSVYLNSTINTGTAVSSVTSVNGTYPAGSSTSNVNVTVTAKTGTLNPGLLFPVSAITGISPGAATVISGSYASFAQGATTVAVTGVTTAGPIVPGSTTAATNLTFFAGYPGYVSAMASQTAFTFTFSSAVPSSIAISSISGNETTASVTTSAAHKLVTGSSITIAGATPAGFNVTATIIVTGTTTFTFTSTVNATASVVGSITAFTLPAGTFSSVVSTPPSTGSRVATIASWVATTNSTTAALTSVGGGSPITLTAGFSVPVSAFGGNGGYAYVAASPAPASGTATVIFSQAQTLASGSGASLVFNPSPATTASDLCDLAFATLAQTTSNNATASTGSFVANFVVPQTFAAGSFTGQTLSLGLNLAAQIMPFVADPIPAGTSNLTIVAQTNTVGASSGLLNNGMQTATASFLSVFGSNAYVTYSNALSNAFVINFPPLATSITKAQVTGLGSQLYVYPNTRFVDQLRVNDKVVIRGMTHTVVQIQTQGTMIVNPPYRGVGNITVPVKMCKVKEVRTPQSQFNRDTIDGTGPSGFKFDPTKMQMIGLQYTWYGAGFVDFMMRGGDGNWVYAHRYKQNNINDEAYMRTGNMPVRYELINESVASSSALAAPTGLTDTTLTLTEAPTYWPPSGNVLVDNEFMTYTGKSGNTLTGIIRKASMAYNVNDQSYTLTASPAEQYHQAGSTALLVGTTCTPSLTHWGSAFIMDGQFDNDRGYFFNYSNVISGVTLTTGQTSNVFMIRLAPSVSNGIVGDMGQRDLLSRAQLLLQKLEVIPTGGTVNVTGILNPSFSPAILPSWSNVNSTSLGSQPSFTQVTSLGTAGANYISGSGERIFSTIAPTAAQNTIDLSALKELSNTIIGGNGIFPDGPDTLMIQLTSVNGSVSAVITNLFWTEAQA